MDTEAEKPVTATKQFQAAVSANSVVRLNPEEKPTKLFIRNKEIITVRAEIAGLSPQGRVEQFQQRIEHVLSASEIPKLIIKDFPPYGSVILADENPVVSIAYLDIDPLDHKTHKQVVTETVAKLSQILAEVQEERSFGAMFRAIGFSLLATVVLSVAIWLLLLLKKLFSRLLETQVLSKKWTLQRITKLDVDKSGDIARRVATFIVIILILFLVFTWLAYVLKLFPYTRPWGEQVWVYVLKTLQQIGLVMLHALPDLFTIALILLIARFIARISAMLINAAATRKINVPGIYPETLKPTRRIIITIIYLFALVAVYPYLPGSSSNAFKGVTVLVGLMISLGGSGVINQAMSGLVLMYTRAHQVGDYVRIGETEGVVIALDMLATKIKTSKNEEVTMPNSVVLSTSTKNYTRLAGKDGVILHTKVTIGYSVSWRKVHARLIEAANRTQGLKKKPAPFVQQTALSDFSVEYQLNAYLEKPEKRPVVLSELHTHIQDSFNEAGIAIVSPHYVSDPADPMPSHDDLPTAPQQGQDDTLST